VYGVSKQGGRDFEKGVEKVTNKMRLDAVGVTPYEKGEGPSFYKSAEKKTNEEAVPASASPGVTFQTPATLPSDNMDTFALAGPGKKIKKKKIIKKVSTFSDFLKSKD
jgi:hypothetical protein